NVNQDYAEVIQAADDALAIWKDAYYDYTNGDSNPLQMNQWGESKADPGWDYANNILDRSAPGEFFLVRGLGYDDVNHIVTDPRQPLLMTPNTSDEYLSIIAGEGKIAVFADEDYPNLYGSHLTQDRSPMPFFTEEELHFIKAEAYFQSGNPTEAFNSFQEGIEVNMTRVGVAGADIAAFLSGPTVPQSSASLTLSNIMMQKYVALYLQGETWVDMRRHDYDPQIYVGLQRPNGLAFYWDEDDETEWIERLPYDTETEELYNKPTLEELGAFQNPDWLKQPMMWAK
ncbi:MAG: SusD/RagB family nutrient-binding outer membrane lipoprotein, partial [Cyclobacteriaceae bacterium]|nr:SusD/RagB family nutrient-binding outer membrane lipoprotein [Cyclobacteriaceae bacterium HetDA_MAG_MS6]